MSRHETLKTRDKLLVPMMVAGLAVEATVALWPHPYQATDQDPDDNGVDVCVKADLNSDMVGRRTKVSSSDAAHSIHDGRLLVDVTDPSCELNVKRLTLPRDEGDMLVYACVGNERQATTVRDLRVAMKKGIANPDLGGCSEPSADQ